MRRLAGRKHAACLRRVNAGGRRAPSAR